MMKDVCLIRIYSIHSCGYAWVWGVKPDTRPGGESGELTEGLEVFDGHKLGLFVVNGV